jgi:hypothetical protein
MVDQAIEHEADPEAKRILQRYRAMLVGKAADVAVIRYLRTRNAALEDRFRPHLVEG